MSYKKRINLLISDNFNDNHIKFLNQFYEIREITVFSKLYKDYKDGVSQKISYNLVFFTNNDGIDFSKYDAITLQKEFTNELFIHDLYGNSRVPCIGIGNGSHLLTLLNGGSIIKGIENHDQEHLISTKLMENIIIDLKMLSDHKEMMNPFSSDNNDFTIIAWSKYFLSNVYLDNESKQIKIAKNFLEPEITYYHNKKTLCIQGNIEDPLLDSKTKEFIIRLIKKLIIK